MEYSKYSRKASELTEVVVVIAVLALIIVPFAFLLGREGASGVVLLLAFIIGCVAFVLSWVNLGLSKTNKQRLGRLLLAIFIPIAGVGVFSLSDISLSGPNSLATYGALKTEVKAVSTVNAHAEQDAELISILQSIGATGNYSNLNLSYHHGDMASVCGSSNTLACYKRDSQGIQSITVSRQPSNYQLKTILAHEYLHYGWHKNDLDKDSVLTSYLIDFYAKNPDFQNKIPGHYLNSGGLHAGEIFSYACTEMPEARLGGYLASKCNEFIDLPKLASPQAAVI